MADIVTARQFRALAGYTGVDRVFRPIGKLDPIFQARRKFDTVRPVGGTRGIQAAREIRRACLKALSNAARQFDPDLQPVYQLLDSTTNYIYEESYFVYGGKHDTQIVSPGGANYRAAISAAIAPTMSSILPAPGTASITQSPYDLYVKRVAGSRLSIGLFAKHMLSTHVEDDPGGKSVPPRPPHSPPRRTEDHGGREVLRRRRAQSLGVRVPGRPDIACQRSAF